MIQTDFEAGGCKQSGRSKTFDNFGYRIIELDTRWNRYFARFALDHLFLAAVGLDFRNFVGLGIAGSLKPNKEDPWG
jgi:hypothetical protein